MVRGRDYCLTLISALVACGGAVMESVGLERASRAEELLTSSKHDVCLISTDIGKLIRCFKIRHQRHRIL